MSESNGDPRGEAAPTPEDRESFSEIDGEGGLNEWIFLVPTMEEMNVLAHCTERGFLVDCYARPGIEKGLRGRKLIIVFPGKENKDQWATVERFKKSKALS